MKVKLSLCPYIKAQNRVIKHNLPKRRWKRMTASLSELKVGNRVCRSDLNPLWYMIYSGFERLWHTFPRHDNFQFILIHHHQSY